METKELKIIIPENQEIDWQESAKQEKIVFKKKDTKPRSWEEFCKEHAANNKKGYFISDVDCDFRVASWSECLIGQNWRNVLPSKELAGAFLAMMQLISIRQDWIGEWDPYWENSGIKKYCICCESRIPVIEAWITASHPLSFPTYEMAKEFLDCFKDLIEQAKPLL